MKREQLRNTPYLPVIVDWVRSAVALITPTSKGGFADLAGHEIAAQVLIHLLERTGIDPHRVAFGEAGYVVEDPAAGQAPETQAFRNAGFPWTLPTSRSAKVCGTGILTIDRAADHVRVGRTTEQQPFVVPVCWEKMSIDGIYLSRGARGEPQAADPITFAGLTDPFSGQAMGRYGAEIARHWQLSERENTGFAAESYERALQAAGAEFPTEIVGVGHRPFEKRPGSREKVAPCVTVDEGPVKFSDGNGSVAVPPFKGAFGTGSPLSPFSASTLNDGAWAALITTAEVALNENLPIAAVISAPAIHSAREHHFFPEVPVRCTQAALARLGWDVPDTLFEVNEAFSAVPLAVMKAFGIPRGHMNPLGGAVSIGHPLGMSGGRIVGEAILGMRKLGLTRALASACIGSGQAIGIPLELVE